LFRQIADVIIRQREQPAPTIQPPKLPEQRRDRSGDSDQGNVRKPANGEATRSLQPTSNPKPSAIPISFATAENP
jgi:hypothetical protein